MQDRSGTDVVCHVRIIDFDDTEGLRVDIRCRLQTLLENEKQLVCHGRFIEVNGTERHHSALDRL